MKGTPSVRGSASPAILSAFFLSGSAAIIYQLIWQRVLSGVYGASVESVTTVVAAFMLGLGAGSLAGGHIADRLRLNATSWFVACEISLAAFGWSSVPLFRAVGLGTIGLDPRLTWFVVGLLLVIPTALMGATLPILTAGSALTRRALGPTVGKLYAANAIGAGVGSVVTVLALAGVFGQQGAARCAAGLNLTAALVAWLGRRS